MNQTPNRKQLIYLIRKVLLSEWDPLFVGSNPKLADEYDDYIDRILQVFEGPRSPDLDKIVECFQWIEEELGVHSEKNTLERVAKKLKNLFSLGTPAT